MSEPFIGEIKIVGFNFPPRGWAFCNGQTMAISQNQALFSILGTTYGGNGVTTFALPNLQGRAPVHPGTEITLGASGGETAHALTINEIPAHNHAINASNGTTNQNSPANNYLSPVPNNNVYSPPASANALMGGTTAIAGASQPHVNMQPFLVLNFVIALNGIFPSRN